MSNRTSTFVARVKRVFEALWAFPVFLLISLIPWLIAAHAFALSHQFYEAGSSRLGLTSKIIAIVIAAFTIVSTLWCFSAWCVVVVQRIFGFESKNDA